MVKSVKSTCCEPTVWQDRLDMLLTSKPEGISDLMYQIKNFHGFLWLSGGAVSDFLIHNIDEMCWMKDALPVSAKASGGRHYRGDNIDQNFDTYAIEYTFEDGTKAFERANDSLRHNEFASYAHGSKGIAVISQSGYPFQSSDL